MSVLALSALLAGLTVVSCLHAQAPAAESPARETGAGWIWLEQFAGSANTYGQVMTLTSTTGYNFNSHVGIIAGLPIYFIRNYSSTAGASAANGVGDLFAGLRLAWANPVVNYRMTLIGAAPTGDSSKGLSTGRVSYDWTNHFDKSFGPWTPFTNLGLANSVPNMLFAQRQFESYGHVAHFEAGAALNLPGPFSASASAYDIEPWGTQKIFSRVVRNGGPPAGAGSHGRVFELNQETTGGVELTRDNGFNAGLGVSFAPLLEFWAGYNHSTHFDLNTVSFGVGVNMTSLLGRARRE